MNQDFRQVETHEYGQDSGQGNLLGVQPFMERTDYASEEAFYNKMAESLQLAAAHGWVGPRTVIVLPEYLGTWLVAAGEPQAVLTAPTIQQAMRPLALRHLGAFGRELLRAREKDRLTASLFRVKAETMAQIYQSVFARLARELGATIVAGSILLPNPRVEDGQVRAGQGPLVNASFVFAPDGRAHPQVAGKVYPIASELPFVSPAPADALPVYETPAGRLGVLVCADSWFPDCYQRLKDQKVELLAVPSASAHGEIWQQPWGGYNGWPAPQDVDPADVGSITERQAWGKYALAGRFAGCGARAGVNVFLYGDLWDLEFNGGRWRMVNAAADVEASRDGAALINLWL